MSDPPCPESPKTSFTSRPLSVATLFYLSTLGGAHVCNLENQIGSLEVGKAFDAIVVDLLSPGHGKNPNMWGVDDDEDAGLDRGLKEMLERFFYCGDDRNMKRVYVQGRLVGGVDFKSR